MWAAPTDICTRWSEEEPVPGQEGAIGFQGCLLGRVSGCEPRTETGSWTHTGRETQDGNPTINPSLITVWTADRWAPFVTGFFFGPAILKILGLLIVGDDSCLPVHSMTRTGVLEFLAYALSVVFPTSRFVGKRPAMTTVLTASLLHFSCSSPSSRYSCLIPYLHGGCSWA